MSEFDVEIIKSLKGKKAFPILTKSEASVFNVISNLVQDTNMYIGLQVSLGRLFRLLPKKMQKNVFSDVEFKAAISEVNDRAVDFAVFRRSDHTLVAVIEYYSDEFLKQFKVDQNRSEIVRHVCECYGSKYIEICGDSAIHESLEGIFPRKLNG